MFPYSRPKIGLALGGGGQRGLAHIGVLKVLEQENIRPDFITGTSIGALVGALYSHFGSVAKVEEFALNNNWREILPLVLDPDFKGSLLSGNKLVSFLNKVFGYMQFSDLKIPFAACCTNFETGELVTLNSGSVAEAVRASCSVPLLLKPYKYNNLSLVDGGLNEPLPIFSAKKLGAQFIIAVNLYTLPFFENTDFQNTSINKIFFQTFEVFLHNLTKTQIKDAQVVITPKCNKIGLSDLLTAEKSRQGIEVGIVATNAQITEIKTKLKKFNNLLTQLKGIFKLN